MPLGLCQDWIEDYVRIMSAHDKEVFPFCPLLLPVTVSQCSLDKKCKSKLFELFKRE